MAWWLQAGCARRLHDLLDTCMPRTTRTCLLWYTCMVHTNGELPNCLNNFPLFSSNKCKLVEQEPGPCMHPLLLYVLPANTTIYSVYILHICICIYVHNISTPPKTTSRAMQGPWTPLHAVSMGDMCDRSYAGLIFPAPGQAALKSEAL